MCIHKINSATAELFYTKNQQIRRYNGAFAGIWLVAFESHKNRYNSISDQLLAKTLRKV